jgi:hypothetical protein
MRCIRRLLGIYKDGEGGKYGGSTVTNSKGTFKFRDNYEVAKAVKAGKISLDDVLEVQGHRLAPVRDIPQVQKYIEQQR